MWESLLVKNDTNAVVPCIGYIPANVKRSRVKNNVLIITDTLGISFPLKVIVQGYDHIVNKICESIIEVMIQSVLCVFVI